MDDVGRIAAAQAGDREAFGALVEQYHGFVYRLCYQMAGNTADAEDLAQDAFVEAYLKLRQVRDPQRFAGWLRTLALNVCRMWHRRRRLEMTELPEETPAPPADPEEEDPYARVSTGLARLSPPLRMALVLHYLEGLSYQEMAAFLAVPIGTVMSRLHRARRSLKEVVEKMAEEENPMIPDGTVRQEVDAEIALLLRMAGERSPATERLSVILGRSPERLTQLLRDAEDGETGVRFALLLPRLGAPAMDTVLDACASQEEELRRNARLVVGAVVSQSAVRPAGTPAWSRMAGRPVYLLLDRAVQSAQPPRARVEMLLGMMCQCPHEPTLALLSSVMACDLEAASEVLIEILHRLPSAPLYSLLVLFCLCRMGTRFVAELPDLLTAADRSSQDVGLAGAEAVARSLDHPWLDDATPEQFANEVRTRAKWPPLRREDLDAAALREMAEATAALATGGERGVRAAAVHVLGILGDREYVGAIRAGFSSGDADVRRAAALAVADMGDKESGDALMRLAAEGTPSERRTAVEALGRLQVREAEGVLVQALGDPDPPVQRAAVSALGEIGGETARARLQQVLRSGDKQLAQAAARALHGGTPHRPISPLTTERLRRVRGEARPFVHFSADAAIRFGFPEIRAYEEREVNQGIGRVCGDVSGVRRALVDEGLMSRSGGVYQFTDLGKAVWRVERYIRERYTG